jgi:hypothetical protein
MSNCRNILRRFALCALALAAACGGSSGTQQLSQPSVRASATTAAAPPLTEATLQPPSSSEPAQSSPDPAVAPEPVTAQAQPGAAYAGTATAAPARRSTPPPSPSPRRTPTPVAGTVTVTDDDSGSTVHLVSGQHLRVRLSQGTWDPPDSTDSAVVARRSSSGGYPSDQPVDAVFDAVGRGSAQVTAQSDAACFHTQPRCLMATRQWQVSVVVS